jgi:acyl-CoA thioesterase-1
MKKIISKNDAQFNSPIKKVLLYIVIIFFFIPVYAQKFIIKIACVGNSITEGYGRDNGNSYPNQLNALLGDNYDVRNFGVGGRTMLKNGDYPYWNETVFEIAQDFEPDIVIILLGTNDSKPHNWVYQNEFYSDYIDMVNVFRGLDSEPEIFVGFPPPVLETVATITDSVVHDEVIPLIDSVRTKLHTFHINFYDNMAELGDLSGYYQDGVHPNAAGYGEMANIAAEALLNRPSGVITYFYADPYVIEEEESTTLYWEASDSSLVTLDNQLVGIKDSLIVYPSETTEFTLIASGEFNDTSIVKITYLPSGLIKSFYASPAILEKDTGDSSLIFWETTKNSQVRLDGNAVARNDSMIVTPGETVTYTLVAEGAVIDTNQITIEVLDASEINRSLLALSYSASSTEYKYSVESAFDNDTSTYWLSRGYSAEWISLDLGKELYINRIKINWGEVYATSYRIEVMDEQNQLSVFSSSAAGTGGIEDISRDAIKGRQVRILCLKSSSSSQGYEIKELEVYGSSKSGDTALETMYNIPHKFSLMQNYPNPFNPVTTIKYTLAKPVHVHLDVFDIRGSKMINLVDAYQKAGEYLVKFDGTNISSGFYFYRIKAGTYKNVKRMLIVK